MSQAGPLASASSVVTSVVTLTGNTGGPVPPDGAGNIDVLGSGGTGIETVGNPGLNTITVFADQATTTQRGTIETATNAEAAAQISTTAALTPSNISSFFSVTPLQVDQGGTGDTSLTAHAVLLGNGTSPINSVGPSATAGAVLLSTGAAADPAFIAPTAGTGLTLTTNAAALQYALSTPVSIANGGTNATSMATTDGTVYFDGTRLVTTATGTAGQVLTSNGAGVAPTYQAVAASSITIAGDTGSTTGNSFTITGGSSGANFAMAAGTLTESFNYLALPSTTAVSPVGQITVNSNRFLSSIGTENTFLGENSGNITLTTVNAQGNTGIGWHSLLALTTGDHNTALGQGTLLATTTGQRNIAIGSGTLPLLTTGSFNIGIGLTALNSLTTGSNNIGIGVNAGQSYASSESSNICIGNIGTVSDANTIRIGSQGSSTGQQNLCFIAGITGVTTSNSNFVTINTSTGQLGAAAQVAFSSTNIQVFAASGTYTPTANMKYCIIEVVGGGGGGGGCVTGGSGTATVGAGGGAGGYARQTFSAATIGVSQSVTCGTAGTAGANTGGTGGTGGTTSVGALISATGGVGGPGSAAAVQATGLTGGAGGVGTGTVASTGAPGTTAFIAFLNGVAVVCVGGAGGNTVFGGGGAGQATTGGVSLTGNAGTKGGGGGGAIVNGNSGAAAGGAGGVGYVVITEFI